MKAAVMEGIGKMSVREVPTPDLTSDRDILLRVKACAVCGSDLRILAHGNPRVKPPQVCGHEIAGEVVAAGAAITNFKVGDRVAVGADVPCGECDFCRNGLGNNCKINYAIGYQFPGGFAEYILLNETTTRFGPVHVIPERLEFEEAALAEPLGCCIHGLEMCDVRIGDTVLIFGPGPIGCMLVKLARLFGAGKVILAGRGNARISMAKDFGADHIVSVLEKDPVKTIMDLTGGRGADAVLTACSSPDAQEQALQVAAQRGRVNFFGGLPAGSRKLTVDSNLIHYRECSVFGSHGSVPRHHKAALALLGSGTISGKSFISHRFPLDGIEEAFRTVREREGMKAIIVP
ncbi:MAG TPA: alcohol dehydrogenase catalytic domain-containing protein [Candidatus Brocadiia bacterium]|nr:alcohol dehydrogenase catalytic domain-containing protein [Candidatus Brocadiia bacterium]